MALIVLKHNEGQTEEGCKHWCPICWCWNGVTCPEPVTCSVVLLCHFCTQAWLAPLPLPIPMLSCLPGETPGIMRHFLNLQQETLLAWCHHSKACTVWRPGGVSRSQTFMSVDMASCSLKPDPQSLSLRHMHRAHAANPFSRCQGCEHSCLPLSFSNFTWGGGHMGAPHKWTDRIHSSHDPRKLLRKANNNDETVDSKASLPPSPLRGGKGWAAKQEEVRTHQPWAVQGRKDWLEVVLELWANQGHFRKFRPPYFY